MLFTASDAEAVWTASGTCCLLCSAGGVSSTVCDTRSVTTFTSKSVCETRLSQAGVGDCHAYDTAYCTAISFTPGSCTGSDDYSGRGGGLLPNTGGSDITSGTGGLANDFGTSRVTGPEQGQPTFTSHATTENMQWMKEVQGRYSPIGSLRDVRVPKTTSDYENRYITGRKKPNKGKWLPPSGSPYWTASPIAPAEIQWSNPTPITADGGQILDGVGASQGHPPPTPAVKQPGTGTKECEKTWWHNTRTDYCYSDENDCKTAPSDGAARCYQTNP